MATTTTITRIYFHSLPFTIIILFSFIPSYLEGSDYISTTQEEPLNESSRLLDLILRDYTLNSFKNQHYSSIKTGVLQHIHLPSNYSGIQLDAVRFRCGSLRRYGAQIHEFHISTGAILEPCNERLIVVRQILRSDWSDIYYKNYDLSGYKLVSPVLGLLAYNALNDAALGNSATSSYQISLFLDSTKDPSTVDFRNVSGPSIAEERTFLNKPMCVTFGLDGKVTFAGEVRPFVCAVKSNGHFGLVVTDDTKSESGGGGGEEMKKEKIGRWRSVVGGLVGSVTVGVVLLGFVVVTAVVTATKRRRRAKREEMERKAYEEEALRVVSMAGHSRFCVASATRTLPGFMEHDCVPN